jgi:2-dehydropantoate 2-reductase
VQGTITLVSWQSPLPGREGPEGTAYWFPPMSATPFEGEHAADVVGALRRGGCPAKPVSGLAAQGAMGSAALLPIMAALEVAGWSLATFRGEAAELAHSAICESTAVAAAIHGTRVPFAVRALRPWALRLLSRVAPALVPFPLEPYLKFHFTKVGGQTRQAFETWSRLARERALPHGALDALAARLIA